MEWSLGWRVHSVQAGKMSDLDDELAAAKREMMMDRSRRSLAGVDSDASEEEEEEEEEEEGGDIYGGSDGGDIFDGISDNEYSEDEGAAEEEEDYDNMEHNELVERLHDMNSKVQQAAEFGSSMMEELQQLEVSSSTPGGAAFPPRVAILTAACWRHPGVGLLAAGQTRDRAAPRRER